MFDSNGTLLDLSVLDRKFDEAFGAALVRQLWFGELLRTAMAMSLAGDYSDFSMLADAALDKVASEQGTRLTTAAKQDIIRLVGTLPPYPEVKAALSRLKKAGFRLAVLTNSAPDTARQQMDHSGLAPLFDRIMSVDPVGRYKPAPEPYQMAAQELGVAIDNVMMIAAHDWDIKGAVRAGCGGAFLRRPGQAWLPAFKPPIIVADDLADAADQIIARFGTD
ncbi:MAG TPA: haloacid dehalogenase type II [Gammaproteobacteria bacterium]|nr:haloacid dehalogenase type II [Gammaproteobacteria bacterium]